MYLIDFCHFQAVRVEHCERVHLIVAAKRICIANCRECISLIFATFSMTLFGGLSFLGPLFLELIRNVICLEIFSIHLTMGCSSYCKSSVVSLDLSFTLLFIYI